MEDIGTKDDWAAAQRVFILSGVPESMGVPPSTLEPPHPDETNRRIVADFGMESRHTLSMGSEPLKLQEKLAAEYHARWEAVETVKAQELAALTEERARAMILSLGAVEAWRDRPDWSGLVEQQAIFQRGVANGTWKAC